MPIASLVHPRCWQRVLYVRRIELHVLDARTCTAWTIADYDVIFGK